jgi:hypothetical protein
LVSSDHVQYFTYGIFLTAAAAAAWDIDWTSVPFLLEKEMDLLKMNWIS